MAGLAHLGILGRLVGIEDHRAAGRRVYAASYPATANANTLTVHTMTPAIVIRTVCCHMVSIPCSGWCCVER